MIGSLRGRRKATGGRGFLPPLMVLLTLSWIAADLAAQLPLRTVGEPASVDFSGFAGDGVGPGAAPGELDSELFALSGMSDGDVDFGAVASGGDFARGLASGGVTSGGLYAFDLGGEDRALGFQPTSGDFTPGSLTLRARNASGAAADRLVLAYELHVRNNASRASRWSFDLSVDGSSWIEIPQLEMTTPEASEPNAELVESFFSLVVDLPQLGLPALPPDGPLFLRWRSDDATGGGSRDEVAIDDIEVALFPALHLFTDETRWRRAVGRFQQQVTSADGLLAADEIGSPPGPDAQLCGSPPAAPCGLTFPPRAGELDWGFRLRPVPEESGLVFADDGGAGAAWQGAISVGDAGELTDDDFEIEILSGPPLTALGFRLLSGSLAGERVSVFGEGSRLLGVLEVPQGVPGESFLGVVAGEPISGIRYDESDDPDDLALRDLSFARPMVVTTPFVEAGSLDSCSLLDAASGVGSAAPVPPCVGEESIFLPAGLYRRRRTSGGGVPAEPDVELVAGSRLAGEGPARSILDGAGVGRLISVTPPPGSEAVDERPAEISGLTLRDGWSDSAGGALLVVEGARLLLSDAVLSDNRARRGGAISAVGGRLEARRVLFSGNHAVGREGGAGEAGGDACGGAVAGSDLLLENVTLTQNRALGGNGDEGFEGGEGMGGALCLPAGTSTLRNVTLFGNSASTGGSDLWVGAGATLLIGESLFAGVPETAPDCWLESGATWQQLGPNLFPQATACPVAAVDLLGEAELGPLAENGGETSTHFPSPSSPALDGGSPGAGGEGIVGCARHDQRGRPRPAGPACDVGAVEAVLDLGLALDVDLPLAVPGVDALRYDLVVSNEGERDTSASVEVSAPAALDCVWSCTAEGGAGCAGGTPLVGGVEEVWLPAGDVLSYLGECAVDPMAFGSLGLVASVGVPGADVEPDDNAGEVVTELDPQADLSVELEVSMPPPFGRLFYELLVANAGPSGETGARVLDSFPPELEECVWSCDVEGGAVCDPQGTGDLDEVTRLPAGSMARYRVDCRLAASVLPGTTVLDEARVEALHGTDPRPENDVARAVVRVVDPAALIFADGFESGDSGAWSSAVPAAR